MNKRIYLASPHMCGKEQEYVNEAFETNWIAPLGPHVNAFEKEIANYVGVKSAAALSSGTAGIHLALISLGIGEGDVVFCSSLTFSASCNPIIYQKATPVFIDSEPDSFNMSPIALEKAFKEHKPKAVIVVHLYGQSANMDKIKEICERHNVPIIEDAAESLGATYKGKMTGTFGKFGIYSFNGNKIITTSGGGMVVSDDEEAIEKIRFWATQARDPARHYQHSELGFNYRMSNVCAGIGRGQLTVLEKRIEQKKAIYNRYKEAFADIDEIEMMPICDFGKPNYWLSVITLKEDSKVKPLDIMVALEEENIESRPVWKPMHLQPFYKDYPFYNHNDKGISISEDIFNRGICLPSDTKMTDEDVDRIIDIIRKEFRK
jgi:dTDP-4-amino-4,6-dideoxygalactose transaminase